MLVVQPNLIPRALNDASECSTPSHIKSSGHVPPPATSVAHRCSYKGYSEEQLCRAYEAVKGGLSI